jgi:hypothetical protein
VDLTGSRYGRMAGFMNTVMVMFHNREFLGQLINYMEELGQWNMTIHNTSYPDVVMDYR